jgi:hypothetical protein
MKTTKEELAQAVKTIEQYRGKEVYAIVNKVSRSGMSRRIEIYVVNDEKRMSRIGWLVAQIAGYSYDIDKGGILAEGCGMDMIFSILSNFNYAMAQIDTGKTLQELLKSKECGEHIYDTYFFNASYTSL